MHIYGSFIDQTIFMLIPAHEYDIPTAIWYVDNSLIGTCLNMYHSMGEIIIGMGTGFIVLSIFISRMVVMVQVG